MALTLSSSLANWGITVVSVVPITLVTMCEFVSTMHHQTPQFFFFGARLSNASFLPAMAELLFMFPPFESDDQKLMLNTWSRSWFLRKLLI